MDGEKNGKPYGQMDDLGGKPTIFGNTHTSNWIFFSDRDCRELSMFRDRLVLSAPFCELVHVSSVQNPPS